MNYYPFHLGDYAAHTAHLDPLEDLAYRRMLDAYYLREAPLPTSPAEVARVIRMRQNSAEVEAVLNEFFHPTEHGWRHSRCDDEIERMQDKQAKARASAAASVNARKAKAEPALNGRSANVERTLNERSTNVELPTPTPTPTPTPIVDATPQAATPARTGSRLADDWTLPDAWRRWAESERPDLDASSVADSFRDFWISKPGKDGRKSDWQATWRNWVRNQKLGHAKPVSAMSNLFAMGR